MAETSFEASQPKQNKSSLKIVLLVLFILATGAISFFSYRFVRELVATWTLTDLEGFVVSPSGEKTPTPESPNATQASEVAPSGGPAPVVGPPPWDGSNRVSLLIMGLDYRDWQAGDLQGPPRTDTMILLTLDPVTKTAGMLSIPRDLWVNIPGFGNHRINNAYLLGEANKLPGGGPQLAMETVEGLLGVPIDYYALIDFDSFIIFIDEIGGVKLDIPEKIKVDVIGDGTEQIKTLKPGVQTLTGELALAYARNRYTDGGDFDRAQRQQQVVLAIRDRLLEKDNITRVISISGDLYNQISSGITTNLSLQQAIRLGLLAAQIPLEDIEKGIIGTEHVNFAKTPDGTQDVLKPLPEKIRLLRDEIFTPEGPIGPSADDGDLLELAKAENARVAILNGTLTPGLAGSTAQYLRGLGLNIPEELVSDSEQNFYTTIIDHSGNPYTLKYLVETMGIASNKIYIRFEPGNPTDIELILGNDWANNNPMP